MIDLQDESFQMFLEEAKEHLQTTETELLSLEGQSKAPDPATINTIFRAVHSIKGTAGFFALAPITELSHALESVLGRIRSGEIIGERDVFTLLLEGTSRLAQMIASIENVDAIPYKDLVGRLTPLIQGPVTSTSSSIATPPVTPIPSQGTDEVDVLSFDGSLAFRVSKGRLEDSQRGFTGGRYVHYVEVPADRVVALDRRAEVVAIAPMTSAAGAPLVQLLCATQLSPSEFAGALRVGADEVRTVLDTPSLTEERAISVHPTPAPPPSVMAPSVAALSMMAPSTMAPSMVAPSVVAAGKGGAHAPHRAEGAGTIRVNVLQLDRLMSLAGELVLTRNALLKKATERNLDDMIELSQRVDTITSDLQDGIMATRMQQVGGVFTKFKRVVRDLSVSLRKNIELEIEGEEVELDKTIIEAIGDPLTHLVRNACDHGVEGPAERLASGKGDSGKLSIRARHEAGQVVIEVADNGRGIDAKRIGAKAIEKGLRTREQIAHMGDNDIVRLIFEAGFSTAEQVSDISGRGVGMDVVVSSLGRVGGTVDIRTEVGHGSTMVVRLPLTLAIIASILVESAGDTFAIPQVNLVELARIPKGEVAHRVERVGSAAVMRLRGELLPLLRLSDTLGVPSLRVDDATRETVLDRRRFMPPDRRALAEGVAGDERRSGLDRRVTPTAPVNIAVVSSGNFRYGIIVDQLLDSEEIVVKPLGPHLSGCREYAGATILGDGRVALILDIGGLGFVANMSVTQSLIREDANAKKSNANGHTYFVFENAPGERFAVPLGIVSRVERIAESSVVRMGGRSTVTFGTSMLALVGIEEVAKVTPRPIGRHFYAVICRAWGREVGIMASHIVDVVDAASEVDTSTHVQPAILGSTVVDGNVLLLLDAHGLVELALPEYKKSTQVPRDDSSVVLVVEDSPFFRKQIVACLHDAGYATLAAEDGVQGLAVLNQHAGRVSLVVTDLEMPNMDGLEMTRRIRADGRFASLPVVAMTSISGEIAERRGREAGLTEYLIKMDREQLVERANEFLRKCAQAISIELPVHAPKGAQR